MLLLFLVACTPEETPAFGLVASPSSIDFGVTTLGDVATQDVTVKNIGNVPLALSAAGEIPVEGLEAELAAGEERALTLTWTPSTPTTLAGTLTLTGRFEKSEVEETVSLTGTADGPVLVLGATEADFGVVSLGCTATLGWTVLNTGTTDLHVTDIVSDTAEVSVSIDPDVPFPWTLAAGESREVRLEFSPTAESAIEATIQVISDDPVTPTTEATVSGSGRIEGEDSVTYTFAQPPHATVLMALHDWVATDARFVEALPTFFDALQAAHAPYRVSVITQQTGEVVGETDYVDDPLSTEDAMRVVGEMLSVTDRDDDYLLETLDNAIALHAGWLFEGEWADSRLSLFGANPDREQSELDYMSYLIDWRALKTDPADVVVSGMAGDYPRGCGTFALLSEAFYDAAAETGGAYFSICEPDWTAHMEELANTTLGDALRFPLTGHPAGSTLRVWVDGVEATEGWSWDEDLQVATVSALHAPAVGAELRFEYVTAGECL